MRNLKESDKALRELLQERILVLDGAMGTILQVTFEGLLDNYYVQAKGLNAPANSGSLGISGSGGNDDGAAVHIEIPRETV